MARNSILKAVAVVVIFTATLGSPSAHADSPTMCSKGGGSSPCPSGTMATGKWRSSPNNFYLCDTYTDGRSVYIHAGWTQADAQAGVFRWENFNGGCITTPALSTGGHSVIYWRVCGNIPQNPDECSAIRSDTV